MDPNEALRRMLDMAEKIQAAFDQADETEDFQAAVGRMALDVQHAAECTLALHQWISGGGFLPQVWQKGR